MGKAETQLEKTCTHCGDTCDSDAIRNKDVIFCCSGCRMVYALLQDNGMGDYYRFDVNPGYSQKNNIDRSFDYLDNEKIIKSLLQFNEAGISKVSFLLPQIQCSACLWLLEHLSKFDKGIIKSSVNFHSKKATITFKDDDISLRSVVELLSKIGYEPTINYDQLDDDISTIKTDKTLIYKLGLAGFSFGNIMLLSFPEYLGFDKASYLFHLGYINIILALPVLIYSGADYLKSAYRGLRMREFNIDLPIALGMIALFGRSLYDILSQSGEGYLDSFSGFVFFLLIGRWFQSFTYQALDFDRNYKSYFPISATVKSGREWITKSLDRIIPSDIILIRNQELIPADSILMKGKARLDYSFVTGESNIITKAEGCEIFAGAKHQGESIEIKVTKAVNQSYLTQLWNEDTFKQHDKSRASKLIGGISKYFTYTVVIIATLTLLVWLILDSSMAINTFTAVLIVACPCALALSIPFTYGNILRLMAKDGFYLRNIETIEQIQDIDYVIFDKTGTLTDSKKMEVTYFGKYLNTVDRSIIKSVCSQSAHPLSKSISKYLIDAYSQEVECCEEIIGKGLVATCLGHEIRIGSSKFIFNSSDEDHKQGVFLEFDGKYVGRFEFKHAFRENVAEIIQSLNLDFQLAVMSGDTDHESHRIKSLIGADCKIYFNQSPKNKLDKIKHLQSKGHKVMMIGDGLNDAGALKQANVGLVISDNENNFSPACDGIIEAKRFSMLFDQLNYLKTAKYIIYGAFALAFMYNSIGLYFAMSGQLSPVIAAILMPLSSITVIVYGVSVSWLYYQKK